MTLVGTKETRIRSIAFINFLEYGVSFSLVMCCSTNYLLPTLRQETKLWETHTKRWLESWREGDLLMEVWQWEGGGEETWEVKGSVKGTKTRYINVWKNSMLEHTFCNDKDDEAGETLWHHPAPGDVCGCKSCCFHLLISWPHWIINDRFTRETTFHA